MISTRSVLLSRDVRILIFILAIISSSCSKINSGNYTVMRGYFKKSIIETGELDAVNASFLIMPRISWQYGYQFKIIGLMEHGKTIHKGDSVIMIDPSSLYKYIIDRQDQLDNEIAASEKQKVEMENALQDLNAQLKNEEATYDLKKLEVERLKFESENRRKIKELEFQQEEIRLNKIKRNLDLKPVLNSLDIKIQKIKVLQRKSEIQGAKEALKRLKIVSPQDGIFQVKRNLFTDQFVRLGDNVYIGSLIASIPDISKMKVKTYINEADFRNVKIGMKVIIRLDALPSVPFNGTVKSVSKICTTRDREKVFNVEAHVIESDIRLKPGMTVSCEYILYENDDALYVPNSCLLKEGGRSFILIKKGRRVRRIEVWSGLSNSYYTIIKGDVEAGLKLVTEENIEEKTK